MQYHDLTPEQKEKVDLFCSLTEEEKEASFYMAALQTFAMSMQPFGFPALEEFGQGQVVLLAAMAAAIEIYKSAKEAMPAILFSKEQPQLAGALENILNKKGDSDALFIEYNPFVNGKATNFGKD